MLKRLGMVFAAVLLAACGGGGTSATDQSGGTTGGTSSGGIGSGSSGGTSTGGTTSGGDSSSGGTGGGTTSGGGTSGGATSGGTGAGGELVEARAVLGALSGATVRVFRYPDLANPIYSTITLSDNSPTSGGGFGIPVDLLNDADLLLLEVQGGTDIDANDDGTTDAKPTVNHGSIHALVDGARLKAGGVIVSIVSEVAYRSLNYRLGIPQPASAIRSELDRLGHVLLKTSVDGNASLDRNDLLAWNPLTQKNALRKSFDDQWASAIAMVHAGTKPYVPTRSLVSDLSGVLATGGGLHLTSALVGTTAYFSGSINAKIADVSDPTAPKLLATLPLYYTDRVSGHTPDNVEVVGVSGGYAFFSGNVLHVIDVRVANAPVEVGTYAQPVRAAVISGSRLYTIESTGLNVIDVSDPAHPKRLGGLNVTGTAPYIDGNRLYLTGPNSLTIVDISDPANPALLGTLNDATTLSGISSVVAQGTYAYASTDQGLQLIDVSTASAPKLVRLIDHQPGALSLNDHSLFLVYGPIKQFDLTDPSQPRLLRTLPEFTNLDIGGAAVDGNRLCLAVDSPNSLAVIDLSIPTAAPLQVGQLQQTSRKTNDSIAVSGGYAYLADRTDGLYIVNVADPSAPLEVGNLPLKQDARSVALNGSTAYLANSGSGLQVVDISVPNAPRILATLATSGPAATVFNSSTRIYLADQYSLSVIDASTATSPQLLGSLPLISFEPADLRLNGNDLFGVVDGDTPSDTVFAVFDVSNPASPLQLGSLAGDYGGSGVALGNGFAYITRRNGAVQVVDISNPAKPFARGLSEAATQDLTFLSPGNLIRVGARVLVAGQFDRLRVIDVSDPDAPVQTDAFDIPGTATHIASDASYVYVASQFGLSVLPLATQPVP